MDPELLEECRQILIGLARKKQVIYTDELAHLLDIDNLDAPLRMYLDPIYHAELAQGRPDLTQIVITRKTGLCFYHSHGLPARTIRVDPNDPENVAGAIAELNSVFEYWATH
jgi:hypothetical protein